MVTRALIEEFFLHVEAGRAAALDYDGQCSRYVVRSATVADGLNPAQDSCFRLLAFDGVRFFHRDPERGAHRR